MKKSLILAAALMAVSGLAMADSAGTGNCGNGVGNGSATCGANNGGQGGNGGAGGNGGQGGQGGQGGNGGIGQGGNGGTGVGVGVGVGIGRGGNASATGGNATGGSVVGSGNSNVRNDVNNTNVNANLNRNNNTNTNSQGQLQGQLQGQTQTSNSNSSVRNSGNSQSTSSSNSGGNVLSTGAVTQSNAGNNSSNTTNQNVSNAGNNSTNAASGNSTNVTVEGDKTSYEAPRIPVATAVAAPVSATNGTCMGSSSAGAQGMTFGVSVASTWKDEGCERRYNSIRLQELGNQKAAMALMCQDPAVRAAMEDVGTPCPPNKAERSAAAEATAVAAKEPTDPFVRRRLGLPELPEAK